MDFSLTPYKFRGALLCFFFVGVLLSTVGCQENDGAPQSPSQPSRQESQTTETPSKPVGGSADSGNVPEPGSTTISWHPPSNEGYVGSSACTECHQELAESYASHPMARSIAPVDIDREKKWISTTGEVVNPDAARQYLIHIHDERLIHSERMLDPQGELVYQTDVPIDYVVGSGHRAVAYVASRDQRLMMSPLNWYTQAERYDFAPGHSAEDPRRFDRRVNDDCLSCHAGQVNEVVRNSSRYANPPFSHAAIGCENCHGPGQNHIAFHGGEENTNANFTDTIVNPEKLDHQRSEAVCYQCHLHAPARLLRPGRSHFDFRPGDRLDDVWTMVLLDETKPSGEKIAPVNQVQQMLSSRCYQASEGRMGCTTCHDPHGVPTPSEKTAFFRSRCLTCHESNDCQTPEPARAEQGDSCTQCHMPSKETTKISHTSQTDHRILRVSSPQPSNSPDTSEPTAMAKSNQGFHFLWDSEDRLPQWEKDRALGMALWLTQPDGKSRPPMKTIEYLAPVFEQHPEDGPTATVLGAFWSQYASPQRAKYYYEAALKDPDVRETALSNLLTTYYTTSDWDAARKCSEQLLEIDPSNARVLSIRADILQHFGETEAATTAAEKALEINPTLLPVREWLVRLYQRLGQTDRAKFHIDFLNRFNATSSSR